MTSATKNGHTRYGSPSAYTEPVVSLKEALENEINAVRDEMDRRLISHAGFDDERWKEHDKAQVEADRVQDRTAALLVEQVKEAKGSLTEYKAEANGLRDQLGRQASTLATTTFVEGGDALLAQRLKVLEDAAIRINEKELAAISQKATDEKAALVKKADDDRAAEHARAAIEKANDERTAASIRRTAVVVGLVSAILGSTFAIILTTIIRLVFP